MIAEVTWHTPGCTIACIRGSHSPESRESYGRRMALQEIASQRPTGVVRTGSLVVDPDTERVTVDDAPVNLTPRELELLLYLAAHVDRVCRHADITRAVWGEGEVQLQQRRPQSAWCGRPGRWHLLRVNLARVRAKLGPAAALIETHTGRGYRLRLVPAEGGPA